MKTDKPMRRMPQQARSQERVNKILDAAAELFSEIGYESASTNNIAERAAISIGSLYRYFPDKDAILHALAARHQTQLQALYNHAFSDELIGSPLSEILDNLVDPFVKLHTSCPAYKHILLGADVSVDIANAAETMDLEIIARIASFLQRLIPGLDNQHAQIAALMCKLVVKGLIAIAPASDDGPAPSAEIMREAKHLLHLYLENIAAQVREADLTDTNSL